MMISSILSRRFLSAGGARRAQRLLFRNYPYSEEVQTRWTDNDIFGHVNNARYYELVDSAVNRYLISRGAIALPRDPATPANETAHQSSAAHSAIGLVVESGCTFFAPLAYPDKLLIGVRVGHIGRSSVRYEMACFRAPEAARSGDNDLGDLEPAAQAFYVHVYVDPIARRPVKALPPALRAAVEALHSVDSAASATNTGQSGPLR